MSIAFDIERVPVDSNDAMTRARAEEIMHGNIRRVLFSDLIPLPTDVEFERRATTNFGNIADKQFDEIYPEQVVAGRFYTHMLTQMHTRELPTEVERDYGDQYGYQVAAQAIVKIAFEASKAQHPELADYQSLFLTAFDTEAVVHDPQQPALPMMLYA